MVLRPFNTDTLAVVAYQLARDERLGEAALPSLALVLVGLMPVVLLSRTPALALAAHEGAAMHEHEQGRALCPLGHEHVHDLARMRPIGDRLAGLTASHTGCPQQRLVQAQHGVARLQDVAGPARAPVPQACVDGRVDCRVLCPRALSHRGQCSLRRRRTSTRS
jgi:hypothetical protein